MVLQCVATIQKEHRKFCLAAEGLGNRLCYLEPTSEAKVRVTHSFVQILKIKAAVDITKKWQFGMRQAAIAATNYKVREYSGEKVRIHLVYYYPC